MTDEYSEDYMEIMRAASESMKLLVEMTADLIEREVEYLDTMIEHLYEQKLFMGAVSEKLDMLKKAMSKHLENVEGFVNDEEKEAETLQ